MIYVGIQQCGGGFVPYEYTECGGKMQTFVVWSMVAQVWAEEVSVSLEKLPTTQLQLQDQHVLIEIADELHERQKGLMFRTTMPENEGMLFVYDAMAERRFWMKNTSIPLSIAYIDNTGVIVHIADMQPFSEVGVSSVYPAQYALEMNQGWFGAHNITVGYKIEKIKEISNTP